MSVSLVKSTEQQIVAHITNLYRTSERLFNRSCDMEYLGNTASADLLVEQARRLDLHAVYLESILEAAAEQSISLQYA